MNSLSKPLTLKVSIRWMERGVFRGTLTPNPAVEKAPFRGSCASQVFFFFGKAVRSDAQAAKKYKLDAPSACKLAEVLECRDDPDADLKPDP